MVRDWLRERRLFVWPTVLVPAAWIASFVANYLVALRGTSANPVLLEEWRDSFMPLPPLSVSDWLWFPRSFADTFAGIDGTPAGKYLAVLTGALALVGCVSLWCRDRFLFTLLTAPIAVTLLASGLRKYPTRSWPNITFRKAGFERARPPRTIS